MHTRPSTIYGIHPKYLAWCFDRAVETFGRSLEDALNAAAEKAKNQKSAQASAQRTLTRWLSSADAPGKVSRGLFRDPMGG